MADFIEAASLMGLKGIRHGFFTRRGGVSTAPYATLNCGPGSGDDPAKVAENRARVASRLGTDPARLLTVHQIHGRDALTVSAPWPDPADKPKADALVTVTAGLAIGSLTADCAPVLFADPQAGVVAAAHAGWRGAIAGVLESAIDAMVAAGARRDNIRAAAGPMIGPGHYEVGEDFEAQVLAANPAFARFFHRKPGARPHFDLPALVVHRLQAAGIASAENLALCTYERELDFHSYRRMGHRGEADYGRQISAIVLV